MEPLRALALPPVWKPVRKPVRETILKLVPPLRVPKVLRVLWPCGAVPLKERRAARWRLDHDLHQVRGWVRPPG
jgi:hypothetical protein